VWFVPNDQFPLLVVFSVLSPILKSAAWHAKGDNRSKDIILGTNDRIIFDGYSGHDLCKGSNPNAFVHGNGEIAYHDVPAEWATQDALPLKIQYCPMWQWSSSSSQKLAGATIRTFSQRNMFSLPIGNPRRFLMHSVANLSKYFFEDRLSLTCICGRTALN
jgi:hypothetical protein